MEKRAVLAVRGKAAYRRKSPVSQSALDHPAFDFDAARQRMVDAQIRPAQINDPRIISLMRMLPRERCVPPERVEFAYSDQSLPIGEGRFLTEPRVIARLIQSAQPQLGERALVIGAASGYTAALLNGLGLAVTAVENVSALSDLGREFTRNVAPEVVWVSGPLTQGFSGGAAYDLILIDGAIGEIPPALVAQMSPGGRIAGMIASPNRVVSAFIAYNEAGNVTPQRLFDASVPNLRDFAPEAAFSL